MGTLNLVLGILLSVRPAWSDRFEPVNERAARLEILADAIAQSSGGEPRIMAVLISSAIHESRLARSVLGCHRLSPRAHCDYGRSTGYFQIQRRTCPAAWVDDSVAGTYAAAECAARLFRNGFATCYSAEGAFVRYNGSHACTAKWAKTRVSTFVWAMGRIRPTANP